MFNNTTVFEHFTLRFYYQVTLCILTAYFSLLLCLTPNDFTGQDESIATPLVNFI